MSINWSPTVAEEVVQNVRYLLVTAPGTVPLSRAMGMPQNLVDAPVSVAGAKLQAAAIKAVRTYEPRAKIKAVRLTTNADGFLGAVAELVGA